MLGALQVDLTTCILPCHFLCLTGIGGKPVTHVGEPGTVDFRPRLLHAVQHPGNRQLNGTHQPVLPTLVDDRPQSNGQFADNSQIMHTPFVQVFLGVFVVEIQHTLGRLLGIDNMNIQEVFGCLIEIVGMEVRLGKVSAQFGIEHRQCHAQSGGRKQVKQFLVSMDDGTEMLGFQEPIKSGLH